MGWTATIEHASGTVTIDSNYAFGFHFFQKHTGRNVVEFIEGEIHIRGTVRESTSSEVADATKEMLELATLRLQPVTVTLLIDGNEKFKYTPATSLAGPTVLEA